MATGRAPYRPNVDREPPAPLRVRRTRCKFAELADRAAPAPHRSASPCPEAAARRIQVGTRYLADVCLWHSLVATQRFGAHLIRDLTPLTGAHS
jgi:hypothetical protein